MSMADDKKGDGGDQSIWILILIVVVAAWWTARGGGFHLTDGPTADRTTSSATATERRVVVDETALDGETANSPWSKVVSVKAGNARTVFQPSDEYVIIELSKRATEPVTISGWMLKNHRSVQTVYENGRFGRYPDESATIPQGTPVPSLKQRNAEGPIVLQPGERAIVTTGSLRITSGSRLQLDQSFKTNLCTGYFTHFAAFTPALSRQCPRSTDITDIHYRFEEKCYRFLKSMARCQDPDFSENRDERVTVNGVAGLSASCRQFIKETLNYDACVTQFLSAENFSGREWRIFLNRDFELFTAGADAVRLYDSAGRLVDEVHWK